jgi:hypothetical protein
MRVAMIALVTIAAALAAATQSGSAQGSFFNERFCTRSTGGELSGPMDCSFKT